MSDFSWAIAVATVRGLLAVVGVGMVTYAVAGLVAFVLVIGVAIARAAAGLPVQNSPAKEWRGCMFASGCVLLAICWALGLVEVSHG